MTDLEEMQFPEHDPMVVHLMETRYKRNTDYGKKRFDLDMTIELFCDHIMIPAQAAHSRYSIAREIKRILYHGNAAEIQILIRRAEEIDPLRTNSQLFDRLDKLLIDRK